MILGMLALQGKKCTTDGMENNIGDGLCGTETEEVFAADFHFHAFSTYLTLEKYRSSSNRLDTKANVSQQMQKIPAFSSIGIRYWEK